MTILRALKLRLRSLFRAEVVEREIDDELRFHLEMQTEENLRAGMPPEEARRRALTLFGGVAGHKEVIRATAAPELVAARISWLDLKLGFRMLVKHPGLTLVGVVAIAVASGFGAAYFEFVNDIARPTLPFGEADRIVGIQKWDAARSTREPPTLRDFAAWRDEFRSVEDLGAFVTIERNLITDGGVAAPISIASISASAFRITRMPALLGRPLVEADESPDAPPVIVIGYDLWQTRFGGDPGVIGRIVRLDDMASTVVGVMPEGFGFPFNHSGWVPFTVGPETIARLQGPPIHVFGRLASGASLESAQAELSTIWSRTAAVLPETNQNLRPRVSPYIESVVGKVGNDIYITHAAFLILLIVACTNVGALMFARTATRDGEFTVRTALGASRGRIVAQLFVEALLLTSVGAGAGLLAVAWALNRWMNSLSDLVGAGALPFWFDESLGPATVVYTAALALVGAVIVGVLPALRVTGRRLHVGLQRASVAASSMPFGISWTTVIVLQVALSVALLPVFVSEGWKLARVPRASATAMADEFLTARVVIDPEPGIASTSTDARSFELHVANLQEDLKRRLADRPIAAGVTMGSRLPGMIHPTLPLDFEDTHALAPAAGTPRSRSASVDADYFEALGIPLLAGRSFTPADIESGAAIVVVNRSFATQFFGGSDPMGQRIRFTGAAGQGQGAWREIVGVVGDVDMTAQPTGEGTAGLYLPLAPGRTNPVLIAVRVGRDPEAFARELRAAALAVDPALRIYNVRSLGEASQLEWRVYWLFASALGVVSAIALLLSVVGIYSLVSFTVARRTREIGIRAALGAQPRRIVAAIFSRAIGQVGLGVALGSLFVALVGDWLPIDGYGALLGVVALVVTAGALACVVPVRRALRVEPTDALRADG